MFVYRRTCSRGTPAALNPLETRSHLVFTRIILAVTYASPTYYLGASKLEVNMYPFYWSCIHESGIPETADALILSPYNLSNANAVKGCYQAPRSVQLTTKRNISRLGRMSVNQCAPSPTARPLPDVLDEVHNARSSSLHDASPDY